jgi:hypothetical protein
LFPLRIVSKPNYFIIVVVVISCFTIVDTSISYVADFLIEFNNSPIGTVLFISTVVVYGIGHFAVIRYIKFHTELIRSKSSPLNALHFSARIIQLALFVNLVLVVIQILSLSWYNTSSLTFATFVCNSSSAILLGWFSFKFLQWFANNTKSLVILLYALSFSVFAFSESMVAVSDTYLLMQKDIVIDANSEVVFYDFEEGTFFASFYDYYNYIDLAAFILILAATSILLYHYSSRLKGIKLAISIGLPLLSYLSGYFDTLNIYDTDTNPDLFSYYIFQSLSTISGGILFAISLWLLVRTMVDTEVRNYIKMAAYGFILFYITNSASVTVSPYPPFGLVSLSLLPLSTYLILVGLYSSAFTVSQNILLRNSIRNMASKNTNLLLNLGTSQMDVQVKNMVRKFKDKIAEEEANMSARTGISTDLQESQIEDYVKDVVKEIVEIKRNKRVKSKGI